MPYYLGLLIAVLSWAGGVYLLTKWHKAEHGSISQHAASTRSAYGFFIALSLISGSVFYIWLLQYLVPKVPSQLAFTILLSLAMLGQFIAALIPDRQGWQRKVHVCGAWGMAVLFLPLSGWLLAADLSRIAWVMCLVCAVYLFGSWTLLAKLRHRFLAFQLAYVITFEVALLAAVYL